MDDIFRDEIAQNLIIVYMDDILIFAPTEEELQRYMELVLSKLLLNDLFLKPEKCGFKLQQVKYLGLIISPDHIAMDPTKLSGIMEWPTPTKPKDVQKFLGFVNLYRRFIYHYADIARPLDLIKQGNSPWNWTSECDQAFKKLKEAFTHQPVLLMPDKTKPFILETDASKVASGAVLRQYDDNGDLHPCGYLSKAFTPIEQRYQIYDRELLAIVRALQTWRHYLLGSPHEVTLWCDHKNLTYFKEPQRLTPRQSRWHLFLSQFDLKIQHQPGTRMIQSDTLSRRPDHEEGEDKGEVVTLFPKFKFIAAINLSLRDKI